MIKPNNLSKTIVDIMLQLAKNDGLARLLVHGVSNPFDIKAHLSRPETDGSYYVKNEQGLYVLPNINNESLITQDSASSKIYPVPFDPEAQTKDASFIRIYYNMGDFNENETIQELNLHIDIVVAKSLWLINNGTNSLIRPYEIMDRVIDLVGKNSVNSKTKVKFDGWQHLAVNTKFDAIRLYSDYFNVETNFHTYDE